MLKEKKEVEKKMKISELLKGMYNGDIVLPDFQRSFIWEPEDVRELLVSVVGNYFMGSILVLEHFKDDSPFALRLIEGLEEVNKEVKIQSMVKILLDGQQRATSLFYASYNPDIPLKNRSSPYRFYLDIEKALKREYEDAIIRISKRDKKKISEISKNPNIIPFGLLRDVKGLAKKFRDDDRFEDIINLATNFKNYEVHIVTLPRDTPPEKIVETFERINRTGEPLSIFDLLAARLYKDKIKLRDLLATSKSKQSYGFLETMDPKFVLRIIALIRGKEPKRKSLLELESKNFVEDWWKACEALAAAYKRVTDIKNGYGVLDIKDWMPYTTMLAPLASLLHSLKINELETKENYEKIDRWYWAAVFSNRYDQAADTKSAGDFSICKHWIEDTTRIPEFIQKFDGRLIDLDIDKQSSAIYRGVINIIVLMGALDFKTGQPPQFGKEKIQVDHIFPKSKYENNSILNRTLISTNAEKSDKLPSVYFKERLNELGEETLKDVLKSHLIPEDALKYLQSDDINNFVEARRQCIINKLNEKIKT